MTIEKLINTLYFSHIQHTYVEYSVAFTINKNIIFNTVHSLELKKEKLTLTSWG